jgi:hypothetical protein
MFARLATRFLVSSRLHGIMLHGMLSAMLWWWCQLRKSGLSFLPHFRPRPARGSLLPSAGQDGSYLAELLLSKGYVVYGIIRRSSSFNTGRIEHMYKDKHSNKTRCVPDGLVSCASAVPLRRAELGDRSLAPLQRRNAAAAP